MGRPSQSEALPSYRDETGEGRAAETASLHSAVSLHGYEEPIDDASLPAYTDEPETSTRDGQGGLTHPGQEAEQPSWDTALETTRNQHATAVPIFSKDPNALYDLLEFQSNSPPRPWIHFEGHHLEKQRQSDGKVKQRTVADFSISLDCTDRLTPGPLYLHPLKWSELYAVPDEEKAFRGFLCRRRAKKPPKTRTDLESAITTASTPESRTQALKTWCHIFTSRAAHSPFPYIFRLQRRVTNWDTQQLDDRLAGMIRATNYRGKLKFKIQTQGETFTVYSEHWMNRLRTNRYVYWACIVLQLWLITWPILLLCTGRFAVVRADWPYKKRRQDVDPYLGGGVEGEYPGEVDEEFRYASMSENGFLETWGRVIVDAAFARRQGEIGHEDYRRVMQLREAERENRTGGMERRRSGNAVVDAAVGIVAGISGVREERDRALGWGGDDVDGGGMSLSVGGFTFGRNGTGRIRLG